MSFHVETRFSYQLPDTSALFKGAVEYNIIDDCFLWRLDVFIGEEVIGSTQGCFPRFERQPFTHYQRFYHEALAIYKQWLSKPYELLV